MSKNSGEGIEGSRFNEAAKIKNDYIESLKDQIQMLQEQLKGAQTQYETALNRLMSMFEQTQRIIEGT